MKATRCCCPKAVSYTHLDVYKRQPKKAAGTAAGLTGFFGYFFGTAILANIAMGSIVQHLGWDWGFIMLLRCV